MKNLQQASDLDLVKELRKLEQSILNNPKSPMKPTYQKERQEILAEMKLRANRHNNEQP